MKFLKNITHKFQGMSNRKKTVVSIASIIVLASAFLMCNAFFNKNSVLDEVRLKNSSDDTSMFAIMLEQSDGTYKESSDKTWPTGGTYVYDQQKSGCIDANGNALNGILSYDAANNKAVVKTKQAAYCYLYFSFPLPDVTVADVDLTKLNSAGYQKTMDCGSTGTATYNTKYQRIEFDSVTAPAKCKFNYTEDTTNYPTLKSEVESKATEVPDVPFIKSGATYTALVYNEYSNITNTSSSPFVWDETNSIWTQTATSTTTSNFKYYPVEAGGYQVCYVLPSSLSTSSSSSYKNYISLYFNSTSSSIKTVYSNYNSGETISGCYDMGYLTPNEYIYIKGRYYDNNISFYIKKTTDSEIVDAGYRYTGKQPDNWIWFNNEMWRIIGSVPVCLNADCTNKENLVKIIRAYSIGGIWYDDSAAAYSWENSTLFKLLNSYYYGKMDATYDTLAEDSLCANALCNYTEKGISRNDYYGNMIKNVYLNIGISNTANLISTTYSLETQTISTVGSKIGIMNASDYGFATSGISYNNIKLSSLASYEHSNWLFGQHSEWTITKSSGTYGMIYVFNTGALGSSYANSHYTVRPIAYLDSSVYVLNGNGNISTPYVIGM